MPLTISEAYVAFSRKVDHLTEQAEALRLGQQICQSLMQRNAELENALKEKGIDPPAPQNITPMQKEDSE